MGIRPNRAYRDWDRPNTRHATRVQRKDFIGGIPGIKIRRFVVGAQTKDFSHVVSLKVGKAVQIRDNAIESFRQKLVRDLTNTVGKDNWTMKLRLFPHHILRENKTASGAGADRVSSGMKHAFGKNIGRAAQIKKGKIFVSVVVDEINVEDVIKLFKKAKSKLYIDAKILVEKHENKILSGRKKWTREAKLAKVAELQGKEVKPTDEVEKEVNDKKAKGKK